MRLGMGGRASPSVTRARAAIIAVCLFLGLVLYFSHSFLFEHNGDFCRYGIHNRLAVNSALMSYVFNPNSQGQEYCGLQPDEVLRILRWRHGCHSGSRRFWYRGAWMDFKELRKGIDELASRPPLNGVDESRVCAIGCFSNEAPCLQEPCLLQFYLRPGTSDVRVLEQLYERVEYDFVSRYELKTILDGGGNIGLASLFFANLFPDSRIISLEPNADNYRSLLMNTKQYRNIIPLCAAIWNSVSVVQLNPTQRGNEWGIMVNSSKSDSRSVKTLGPDYSTETIAMTIDYLQGLFHVSRFDFTKIDIEGSEKEVFTPTHQNQLLWLQNVPLVMVEMHNWMKNGSEEAVKAVLEARDGRYTPIADFDMWKAWENNALVESIRKKSRS